MNEYKKIKGKRREIDLLRFIWSNLARQYENKGGCIVKKVIALLMIVMMLVSLSACGGTSEETPTTDSETSSEMTADSDVKIGVVLKTLSSEYWSYVAAGVESAEEDLGVTVDLQGPASETAYDEQNNMIETMLSSSDLDAMVISPLQPDSVVSVIGETAVPILFVDTDASYDKKVSYIGTGNYDAAYLGGEYAAKEAGEGAKAVVIGGVKGNTSSDEREAGYTDALEANGVEVTAVEYAEGLADKATTIMENFLSRFNNDIDIVVCNNDEIASGASRAANQAGVEDITIVGFDGIQAGVNNVIGGTVSASVAQSPFEMGYQAVEAAVKVAKEEEVEEVIDTGATVVNSENAQAYLEKLKSYLE